MFLMSFHKKSEILHHKLEMEYLDSVEQTKSEKNKKGKIVKRRLAVKCRATFDPNPLLPHFVWHEELWWFLT